MFTPKDGDMVCICGSNVPWDSCNCEDMPRVEITCQSPRDEAGVRVCVCGSNVPWQDCGHTEFCG